MSFSIFAGELEEACCVLSALVPAGQARMLRSYTHKDRRAQRGNADRSLLPETQTSNKDAVDPAAPVRRGSGLLTRHCRETRQASSEGNSELCLGTYYRPTPRVGGTRDEKGGLGFSWLPKTLPSCGTEWGLYYEHVLSWRIKQSTVKNVILDDFEGCVFEAEYIKVQENKTFYTHVNIKIVSKASADQYLDI